MVIKKTDMSLRAAAAAAASPTLGDRIADRTAHARALASAHPLGDELAHPGARSLPTEARTSIGARLEIVPLDLIDPNPFNARKIYLPERVQQLAASLGAHGQEVPGNATTRGGRYVLAAGHYRFKGLRVCGAKTMALMVTDNMTDKELYAQSYRENAEREEQTALDNALAWRNLLDQGVYGNETEIAEATGQSQSNVNRILSALKLSEPTLEVIKEAPGAFGFSILNELVLYEKLAGPERAIAMARKVLAGEAGRRDIAEARAQIGKPSRKSKETSRQYKIKLEGKPIGVIKDWDSGRVSLDVTIADPREREAIVAELRTRFGVAE